MTEFQRPTLTLPADGKRLLLHSCCAPCSGEVMEAITASGIDYAIFFYNPNIHPVKEYELRKRNFSETGNFGFGITEHIDLGLKYDPGIGIFGMDFYVCMTRPGARVARRKSRTSRVGYSHRVKKEETAAWYKQRFDGIILK
mgnify:FL=1